tara:strand:+ start:5995 stop:6537 length:543 start_codon:yes stop_codon:yes gene_type:complete
MDKQLIGFLITYFGILFYIPYYLYFNAHNTLFLTYFANVDIVTNILSINFPEYFGQVYDIDPKNVSQYVSFNFISIIALSGIFMHGISLKNENVYSDIAILITLIIMAIVTWTLPTQLIPYAVKRLKETYNIKDTSKDILITTLISLIFIVLEGILIHLIVEKNILFKNNKWLHNIKFEF